MKSVLNCCHCSLSCVQLFVTTWNAAFQTSLSFTIFLSLLKLMSIESVILSNHLLFHRPLLFLPSIFPNIRVFSSELALHSWSELQFQHQSSQWIFRVDFLQDWLVWFPCCPRDSQKSSPAPQFESINSLALRLLYGSTLTSVHNYWKINNFDYIYVCWKSDISAF